MCPAAAVSPPGASRAGLRGCSSLKEPGSRRNDSVCRGNYLWRCKSRGEDSTALLSQLSLDFRPASSEEGGSFVVQIGGRNVVIGHQGLILNFLGFHRTDVSTCCLPAVGTNFQHAVLPTHTIIYTQKSCTLKNITRKKKHILLLPSSEGNSWEIWAQPSAGLWSRRSGPPTAQLHRQQSEEVNSKGLAPVCQRCSGQHKMARTARDGTAKLSSSCSPALGTADESEAAWSALKAHFFSSQSIRWKRFICNKPFHFRAPLPASAFSLHCRITQNKVNYYALHSSSERSNTLFGKQMTEKFWIKYIWHASETEFITEKE